MRVLERAQYGKRSERLRLSINDEQASFAFEEVETGLSAIQSELDHAVKDKPKRAPRPRKGFAAHLERIEEVVEPEIPADCAGLEKVLIGEDRSERLDVVPPKFRVIVTRRPKYAFRDRDGVVQALAPAHIIESGLPTERLLAHIAVSKYADGLPLYRQEAIYLRDGVELIRSLSEVYQLKVSLRRISPMISRRLLVPEEMTLYALHRTIQIAFGCEDCHLHAFKLHGRHYGTTWTGERHRDAAGREVTLANLRLRVRQRTLYEYDFGDLWEHEMRIEAKHEREGGKVYPVCIAGARAGPPEDIGGPPGHAALLDRLRFGDIERRLCGEDEEFEDDDPLRSFEAERFSGREVNAALRRELSGLTKG